MKRGTKDTVAALALGGGLIAVIAAVERSRARAAAPIVTRGRWGAARAPSFVGLDAFERIADITEDIARAVSDALIDESGGALTDADRPSVIAVVLNAMQRYKAKGAAA